VTRDANGRAADGIGRQSAMAEQDPDASVRGLAVRQQVLGTDYVAHSLATLSEYRRPLLELVTDYGWGSVWTRPGLDRPTRSLLTIAAMAATGHQGELGVHVRGALRQGVTPEQIQETLLQVAVYCGAPAAAEAFATVEAAIAALDPAERTTVPSGAAGAGATVNTKILLLLRTPDDRPSVALAEALTGEAERIRATLPSRPLGLTVGSANGLGADEVASALAALADDGRADFGAPGYQGVLWVSGPGGTIAELTEAVRGVADRLGALIDAEQSAAVAGTEEIFRPGVGPVGGLYAIRRNADQPVEHFHDFWRLEHTKLSMSIPGFRYRQLHAAGYASRDAAASAGLGVSDVDGVVEYFFDDISYQVEMTRLDNFGEIYLDEKNFVDHDRCTFTYVDYRPRQIRDTDADT
jgi:AhpD family alkylhydroperoxidase